MTEPDPDGSVIAVPSPGEEARSTRAGLERIIETLNELSEDAALPRNVRRGAQTAREALSKPRTAQDVRIASAISVLDDLVSDPNIPTHGRTAIWSVLSHLESVQ